MVDSAKGITNFHSPNDVIVDASMPAMIRAGGKMYGADGRLKDVKAVMPESTFARIYQEIINFCKWHGAFDPKTMGTVPNVGLMAQQAEEYGSHDKTFEIPEDGVANITDLATGEVLLTQNVEAGRHLAHVPGQGRADPRLGQARGHARAQLRHAGVFWLDPYRPHENELIKKVKTVPEGPRHRGPRHPDHVAGARDALHAGARDPRAGHHLGHRQHPARLPDRPVPDHGAGHQRQDAVDRAADGRRRHVRDRRRRLGAQARAAAGRGEPPALGFARRVPRAGGEPRGPRHQDRQRARPRSWPRRSTPPPASCSTTTSPRRRKTGELDNRGSQFYLALYWAQELAAQTEDAELAAHFAPLAKALADNEQKIVDELTAVQGKPVDIGGYYKPDTEKTNAVMRPSKTFNEALEAAQG